MPKFEYAPAPESRAIVSLRESYGLFIDGQFTPSADGRAFKTISPATEEVLAEVAEAGPADVDHAVSAAVVDDGQRARGVGRHHRAQHVHAGALGGGGDTRACRERQRRRECGDPLTHRARLARAARRAARRP